MATFILTFLIIMMATKCWERKRFAHKARKHEKRGLSKSLLWFVWSVFILAPFSMVLPQQFTNTLYLVRELRRKGFITPFANRNHHQTPGNNNMSGFRHKIGSLVRVHGLKNATYNGRLGNVVDVSDLEKTGRLLVLLQEKVRPPLLQEIKIKPENMFTACSHCLKAGEKMQFCSKCRVAG